MSKVLIIDPIFRGSRLFYSQLASTVGDDVMILSRSDARTEESDIALAGRDIELREVVTTPSDSWYFHLSKSQLRELHGGLRSALQDFTPDLLFMAGLDELKPAFGDVLADCADRLRDTSIIGVHYTPAVSKNWQFLGRDLPIMTSSLRAAKAFGHQAAKFRKLRQSTLPNLKSAVLDERIYADLRDDPLFMLMPDPPPPIPDPNSTLIDQATADGGSTTFLLVGRQSDRKGLTDVVELLEQRAECLPDGAKFVLCGKLEDSTENLRPRIAALSRHITHIDRYLSDEAIRARYLAADYVLLPYTTGFTSSSGVLASAASACKPVISTEHGLIGYRVAAHQLGRTYPSRNIAALAGILSTVPESKTDEYRELQSNALQFSRKNSVEAFTTILREAMTRNG